MKPGKMKLVCAAVGLAICGGPAVAEIKVSSDDGKFETTLGGRVQVDGAWYSEDNVDLDGENGTEFRRARLFVKGTMYDVWDFKGQYDFAGNEAEIKDAYIRYTGFPFKVTVGQFKQPFGLEELTSSKYITFMERALPTEAFATSRRIGLGTNYAAEHWTLAASLYGREEGDDTDGDQGYGVGARMTWAPWNEKGRVLHLGAAGAWEDPNDNDVRFRARPESHKTGTRLVDTADIPEPDTFTRYGLEAATVLGPFSLQGEYMGIAAQSDAVSDPDFDGWYVYGSWFLTGESRQYKKGAFSRVTPKSTVGKSGGIGAWELAVRYSSIDLDDADTQGGEEDNITVGINWYATKYVRFMANYVMADADPFTQEAGLDVDPPNADDDSPDVFQVRAQIDF
ncbi:MAG: OprO/OprP family phosphate-selective porin [Gammaproteobacteria bacterium]